MRIKYDAYSSGNTFSLDVTVVNKGLLHTNKIFIHKSSDNTFVKIASLGELNSVPEIRHQAEYYRREFCEIKTTTAYEADEARKLIENQVNSLALELKTIQDFYSTETEVNYPIEITPTSEVDELYNEYVKIKREQENLIIQRASLKSKKDTLKSNYDYVRNTCSPLLAKAANNQFNADEYVKSLSTIASLKTIVLQIGSFLDSLKNISTVEAKLEFITEKVAAVNGIVSEKTRNGKIPLSGNDGLLVTIAQNALSRLLTINGLSQSIIKGLEIVHSNTVKIDGTIEKAPILSNELINTAMSEMQALLSAMNNNQIIISTITSIINGILDKYDRDMDDIDKEIKSVNTKIDINNNVMDELRSQILDKNPDFNLELF